MSLIFLFFLFFFTSPIFSMSVVTKVKEVGLASLGEGPHWDVGTKSLFYVDILEHAIHKYTPSTGQHTSAKIDATAVTLIIPVAEDNSAEPRKFLLGCDRYVKQVEWDGKSDKVTNMITIAEVDTESDKEFNRLNDGKCDQTGQLWFGTMGHEITPGEIEKEKGTLYSLNSNGDVRIQATKVGISNGIAFNKDKSTMFFVDSQIYTVDAFDVDLISATLTNRRVVFTLTKHEIPGVADGMTIDSDDNLWVAINNGARVIKIDPHTPETLLDTISIPGKQVTSVAFGGDNLDELYVTTARQEEDGVELTDDDGALYKVTGLGVTGYAGVPAILQNTL